MHQKYFFHGACHFWDIGDSGDWGKSRGCPGKSASCEQGYGGDGFGHEFVPSRATLA